MRTYQHIWQVSSKPAVGDIIDLQSWVQGAYGLDHVAVVERVLSNGHVIASTMNWGPSPRRVLHVEYAPGGVFYSYMNGRPSSSGRLPRSQLFPLRQAQRSAIAGMTSRPMISSGVIR